MEESFKIRHANAITGTFVLVVVAVLVAALVFAGRSQRWFIRNVTLRIALPEAGAAGIRQGSEVYFLGTLMGTVSDVALDASGRLEARANIRHDFFLFVRADSWALVKKKFGVAGDAYFEVTRGAGQPLPEKNASIVCKEQVPNAIEAAVEQVRVEALLAFKKLNGGLDTWTAVGSNLITTRDRVDQLLGRADSILASLQQGKGSAGNFLTDSSAAEELKALLVKANSSMDVLQLTARNLQHASLNVDLASTNLPAISDAVGREARDLPGLVLQTQSSMREMERLIAAMQRHWLLRKYVNPTNPPSLHPSPAVDEVPRKPVKPQRSPKNSTR
ncbi:MAG: phospholipid/cholesterol/gamma-HCH transport system substrate-binding protein [Verrucomicrobiota bacterium]|jgi:phospholipid/cholesterol/gamma-HCH transport system substrate-binding protein